MTHWMIWLVLAGALVILEMFSGTFYLLMVAIGMLAGAAMALAGAPLELQLIVAAVVGMIATAVLRRTRFGKSSRTDPARDPNVNLDIGQSINIDVWNAPPQPGARATARVMYRGALWDVELAHDGVASPGQYKIREMQGSRLIVGEPH